MLFEQGFKGKAIDDVWSLESAEPSKKDDILLQNLDGGLFCKAVSIVSLTLSADIIHLDLNISVSLCLYT